MTSLPHIKQDVEDMKRLSEIATAFFMGGFSYYIKKSGLKKCVSVRCRIRCFIKRKCNCPPEKHSLPLHFREVIENLDLSLSRKLNKPSDVPNHCNSWLISEAFGLFMLTIVILCSI